MWKHLLAIAEYAMSRHWVQERDSMLEFQSSVYKLPMTLSVLVRCSAASEKHNSEKHKSMFLYRISYIALNISSCGSSAASHLKERKCLY